MLRLALIFLFLSAAAATAAGISGTLADSATGEPLSYGSVRLLGPDSTSKYLVRTDRRGKFEIENVAKGEYILYVSFVGYASHSDSLRVGEKDINLGKLLLSPISIQTGEVEVVAAGPEGKQKGDTTEFNASAYYTDRNAMLEELLKKIPGIEIDKDGNIKFNGEDAPKILIDGKPLFDNPNIALKNLPADIVKKITVYNSQSEKSEFAGLSKGDDTKKTINIVTNNKLSGGYFGSLKSAYSAWDRLDVKGNINAFDTARKYSFYAGANNGSLNSGASAYLPPKANYNFGGSYSEVFAGKFDFTGNASYGYNNAKDLTGINREYLSLNNNSAPLRYYNQSVTANNENSSIKLSSRIKYNIDEDNEALFNTSGNWGDTERNSISENENLFESGDRANSSRRTVANASNSNNFAADLSYKRKLDTADHSLAISLSGGYSKNKRNYSVVSNDFSYSNGIESALYQYQLTQEPTDNSSAEGNITYTRPIYDNFNIKLNYTAEYSDAKSTKNTFATDSIGFVPFEPDSTLSDGYLYSAVTHKAGLQFDYKIGKFSLTANTNYRLALHSDKRIFPYESKLDYNYAAILPFVRIEYKIGEKSNLRLNYWTSSQDPNFSQLNSKPNIDNPQYISIGNPSLKSSYSSRFYFEYRNFDGETKSYIFSSITYSFTKDQVVSSNAIFRNDTTLFGNVRVLRGGSLSVPINKDGARSLGSNIAYSFPWEALYSKFNTSVHGYLSRTPGILNGSEYFSDYISGGVMLGWNFDVEKHLESNLSTRLSAYKSINTESGKAQFENSLYTSARIKWTIAETFFIQLDYSGRSQLNGSYASRNSDLLNIGIGAKMFDKKLELSLNAVDVFNSNNNENVSVSDYYSDRTYSKLISRYFSINLDYKISSMGGAAPPEERREPGRRFRF